jgi:hypothetical protein
MNEWCQDLHSELLVNCSHYLTSRQAKLPGNITEDFPDQKVLHLYTHPAAHNTDLVRLSFSCADLQAGQLTVLATVTFQWGRSAKDLFKCYIDLFFPAMSVRQLLQGAADIDDGGGFQMPWVKTAVPCLVQLSVNGKPTAPVFYASSKSCCSSPTS